MKIVALTKTAARRKLLLREKIGESRAAELWTTARKLSAAQLPTAGQTVLKAEAQVKQHHRTDQSKFSTYTNASERASRRSFADLQVTLRGASGQKYAGTIENISETGCLIVLAEHSLPQSERGFVFRLAGGKVATGKAVWSDDKRMGLQFFSPFDQSEVEQLVTLSLNQRLLQARVSYQSVYDLPPLKKWCE